MSESYSRNYVEQACLMNDPASIYGRLDERTKASYRDAAEKLAAIYSVEVKTVCDTALRLSLNKPIPTDPRLRLHCHVGYYLIDPDGRDTLCRQLSTNRTLRARRSYKGVAIPLSYGALAVILSILTCQPFLHHWAASGVAGYLVVPLILVLALNSANPIISTVTNTLIAPRTLPRLNLMEGIGHEFLTLIVIPAILSDEAHVRSLVQSMKEHFVVACDPDVYVVAVTDFPDNDCGDRNDVQESLLTLCKGLVDDLNKSAEWSVTQPFFLLHRDLTYSRTERKWIGWERKRGKVLQFMSFVLSGRNIFRDSVGDTFRLRSAQYALVLDDDSHLGRNSIQRLVGTHAHPLNHPYLTADLSAIGRGFGILQPLITAQSNEAEEAESTETTGRTYGRSWICDVFHESPFYGKGLIHIESFHKLIDGTIPEERVLSHDTVESGFVRCGSVADATVSEADPVSHESSCKRYHRWVRGDWQNIRFVVRAGSCGRKLSPFGKIIILQNMIRSVWMSALAITLSLATLFGVQAVLAILGLVLLPGYVRAAVAAIEAIRFRDQAVVWTIVGSVWLYPFDLANVITRAAHDAAVTLDAVIRTLLRLATRRHLLDWEAASSVGSGTKTWSLCRRYTSITASVSMGAMIAIATKGHNYWLVILLVLWLGYSVDGVRRRVDRLARNSVR
jgi:hypothetical protein